MSNKQILFISIFTFFVILAWIAFDIHYAITASTVTPVQEKLMKPLNPNLDTQVLDDLKRRSNQQL